ncbi:MAG: rod shape-determining protein MreC [Merismopedia sp. SIO2A8]|nr:rod shape-determining protein MreC [Symploca sp. SIO2B6]NET48430.1 rod shape-determining protein MreC [Merismopedia sp. SIO2A8]
MFTLRRWWERYSIQAVLIALALIGAWSVRATKGAVLLELYYWVSYPFQSLPSQEDALQIAQSQELQQRLQELETQNQQLKQLLGYTTAAPDAIIASPIIGRPADQWWQQLTLGRGTLDGIIPNSVVLGTGGVVGRVTDVTPHTSRVLLISDPSSQVGATVSRSRAMGYLRGQAGDRAVMVFFEKIPDVKPGDVIVTSNLSQLFPAGLPIGRVESIDLDKSPVPEATITLGSPVGSLEWVMVHANTESSPE